MYDMVLYVCIQEHGCFNDINNTIVYGTNTIVYGMMYVCIQEHGFNTIVYACMYVCILYQYHRI